MRSSMIRALVALYVLALSTQLSAQDPHDEPLRLTPTHQPAGTEPHAHHHHHAHPGIDLAHPIVGESPLPETHLKLRYFFAEFDEGREHTVSAELEYALTQNFSIEAVLPYTFLDEDDVRSDGFNDTELSFKLASYAWADRNLLPAVGLGIGLPTGDEEDGIGSDHVWELEPFARIGAWAGRFEFIGGVALAIPLNREGEERDEEDFAVHYNLASLYHVAPNFQALLELHGESVFGNAGDEHALYASPGMMLQPFPDKSITLGAGVSLPLTDDREFDYAINILTIIHF